MINNAKIEPVMAGIATLFNYFIFSNIGYAVLALSGTLFHRPTPLFIVNMVPIVAVLTAVYFQFKNISSNSKRPLFTNLTPGEIIAGFKYRAEGKEWAPALRGKKIWWILLSVFNFFVIGRYWQFLENAYVYSWVELGLRILLCFLFFSAMITVGNGRITALLGVFLVISVDYLLTPFMYSQAAAIANGYFNLKQIIQLKSSLWALVNSGVLIYYLYHQNPGQFKSVFTRFMRGRK